MVPRTEVPKFLRKSSIRTAELRRPRNEKISVSLPKREGLVMRCTLLARREARKWQRSGRHSVESVRTRSMEVSNLIHARSRCQHLILVSQPRNLQKGITSIALQTM